MVLLVDYSKRRADGTPPSNRFIKDRSNPRDERLSPRRSNMADDPSDSSCETATFADAKCKGPCGCPGRRCEKRSSSGRLCQPTQQQQQPQLEESDGNLSGDGGIPMPWLPKDRSLKDNSQQKERNLSPQRTDTGGSNTSNGSNLSYKRRSSWTKKQEEKQKRNERKSQSPPPPAPQSTTTTSPRRKSGNKNILNNSHNSHNHNHNKAAVVKPNMGRRVSRADRRRETDVAQKEIDAVKLDAEAARKEAQAARKDAEATRLEARATRLESDALRLEADAARKEAQAARMEAEFLKKQSERHTPQPSRSLGSITDDDEDDDLPDLSTHSKLPIPLSPSQKPSRRVSLAERRQISVDAEKASKLNKKRQEQLRKLLDESEASQLTSVPETTPDWATKWASSTSALPPLTGTSTHNPLDKDDSSGRRQQSVPTWATQWASGGGAAVGGQQPLGKTSDHAERERQASLPDWAMKWANGNTNGPQPKNNNKSALGGTGAAPDWANQWASGNNNNNTNNNNKTVSALGSLLSTRASPADWAKKWAEQNRRSSRKLKPEDLLEPEDLKELEQEQEEEEEREVNPKRRVSRAERRRLSQEFEALSESAKSRNENKNREDQDKNNKDGTSPNRRISRAERRRLSQEADAIAKLKNEKKTQEEEEEEEEAPPKRISRAERSRLAKEAEEAAKEAAAQEDDNPNRRISRAERKRLSQEAAEAVKQAAEEASAKTKNERFEEDKENEQEEEQREMPSLLSSMPSLGGCPSMRHSMSDSKRKSKSFEDDRLPLPSSLLQKPGPGNNSQTASGIAMFKRCDTNELIKEHRNRRPTVLVEIDDDSSIMEMSVSEMSVGHIESGNLSGQLSPPLSPLLKKKEEKRKEEKKGGAVDWSKPSRNTVDLSVKSSAAAAKRMPVVIGGRKIARSASARQMKMNASLSSIVETDDDEEDDNGDSEKPTNLRSSLKKTRGSVSLSDLYGSPDWDKDRPDLSKGISFTLRRTKRPDRAKSMEESVSSMARLEESMSLFVVGDLDVSGKTTGDNSNDAGLERKGSTHGPPPPSKRISDPTTSSSNFRCHEHMEGQCTSCSRRHKITKAKSISDMLSESQKMSESQMELNEDSKASFTINRSASLNKTKSLSNMTEKEAYSNNMDMSPKKAKSEKIILGSPKKDSDPTVEMNKQESLQRIRRPSLNRPKSPTRADLTKLDVSQMKRPSFNQSMSLSQLFFDPAKLLQDSSMQNSEATEDVPPPPSTPKSLSPKQTSPKPSPRWTTSNHKRESGNQKRESSNHKRELDSSDGKNDSIPTTIELGYEDTDKRESSSKGGKKEIPTTIELGYGNGSTRLSSSTRGDGRYRRGSNGGDQRYRGVDGRRPSNGGDNRYGGARLSSSSGGDRRYGGEGSGHRRYGGEGSGHRRYGGGGSGHRRIETSSGDGDKRISASKSKDGAGRISTSTGGTDRRRYVLGSYSDGDDNSDYSCSDDDDDDDNHNSFAADDSNQAKSGGRRPQRRHVSMSHVSKLDSSGDDRRGHGRPSLLSTSGKLTSRRNLMNQSMRNVTGSSRRNLFDAKTLERKDSGKLQRTGSGKLQRTGSGKLQRKKGGMDSSAVFGTSFRRLDSGKKSSMDTSGFVTGSRIRRIEDGSQLLRGMELRAMPTR